MSDDDLPLHRYEVRIGKDKSMATTWWEVMRIDWHSGKPIRVIGQWELRDQAETIASLMTKYAKWEVR